MFLKSHWKNIFRKSNLKQCALDPFKFDIFLLIFFLILCKNVMRLLWVFFWGGGVNRVYKCKNLLLTIETIFNDLNFADM